MPVLGNPRYERIAQELASGSPAELASERAGYRKTPTFASGSRQRASYPQIKERVRELQGAVANKLVDITVEKLQQHVATLAFAEIDLADMKPGDKIAAARLLAQMIPGGMAAEKVDMNLTGDLASRLDAAIKRAKDGKA